jgi:8-oxo-(d)GTP phosphatase
MADAAADGEIHAAGALLWRPSDRGREVALIHRPKYDDWSFPKGKLEPGEHRLLAAVREVAEETGIHAILGRPLPTTHYERAGRPKRVDYWAGRPAPGRQQPFGVNHEVDNLEWLPLPAARGRLSYTRDAATLDEFAAGPADTVPLTFLRHASAGARRDWAGDDLLRPLDAEGEAESELLRSLLSCFGPARVISSAAERCVATVKPYATAAGATVEIEPAFTVGRAAAEPAVATATARVASIVHAGQPAVICAHRENLPPMLTAACAALGAEPPHDGPLDKGGFWVLHTAAGRLAAAEQHDPAGA